MAQKTRAQLDALIAANLPNNVSKLITPAKHREVEEDLTDSNVNILDDVIETSAGAGSAGKIAKLASNGKLDPSTLPASGSAWGGITGDIEDQTDLIALTDLLAPLDSPQITGSPFFDLAAGGTGFNVDGNQVLNIDEAIVQFRRPITENPRTIGDGDSTTVAPTDLLINYERTDAAPLVLPDPGSVSSGQNLKISNRSGDAFDLTAVSPNSFFNGADGVVTTITVQPNQTISLQALVSEWQVINSYLATAPIETVTVSSGAADVGKAVLLDAAGLFDPSVLPPSAGGDLISPLTNSEISITGATTATISRMHVCAGTSANYTVTLPAASGNAGKLIGFRMGPPAALTKLVTIDGNASETIDGATTRIMYALETAILYCDGSNWFKIAGRSIPMTCLMAPSTTTSVATGTAVKIALNTTVVDTSGAMADTTNTRINIVRPGNYSVAGYVRASNLSVNVARWISATYKNASFANFFTQAECSGLSGGYVGIVAPVVVPLVAGDFLELNAFQTSGSTLIAGGTGTTEDTNLLVVEQANW